MRTAALGALIAASASAETVWVDFAKPGPDDPPSEQMVLEAWGATNGLVRFQVSTNLLAEDGWADVSLPIPIYSQNRIALLRSEATRYTLESYFPGYIKIHRYHVRGFY